jgi:hypothetical protein
MRLRLMACITQSSSLLPHRRLIAARSCRLPWMLQSHVFASLVVLCTNAALEGEDWVHLDSTTAPPAPAQKRNALRFTQPLKKLHVLRT